jgi:hypothetical protein
MIDTAGSAVSRTPPEIWWIILDEVIDCPKHFATTYDGDDWAHDAHAYSLKQDEVEYKEKEKQRQNIASVCISWRRFATQRKGRSLYLGTNKNQYPSDVEVKKAYRIRIDSIDDSILSSLDQSADWRILRILPSSIKDLSQLYLPHLRRLIIHTTIYTSFDLNPYLDYLGPLINLTWLEFSATNLRPRNSTPTSEDKRTVLLPNLQVFICLTRSGFLFPFESLELPSLRHLSVRYNGMSWTFPPIDDILLRYRTSLKSVSITSRNSIPERSSFPQWEELPVLQELVLDGSFPLHFHPLPRTHPLKRFYVRHQDVNSISTWMDSDNLRQIRLLGGIWDHGALKNLYGVVIIGHAEMKPLVEKAKMRGICLEASLVSSALPSPLQ